jgi:hypothetical protein
MRGYAPENSPETNLEILAADPYIGRFVAVGRAGKVAVQACAITGRSEGSRNRRYRVDDFILGTEVADNTKPVGNPDLTIYDSMRRVGELHVVSNGDQTGRVVRFYRGGKGFEEAMAATDYEPDELNTPRISAFHLLDVVGANPHFGISVIRKAVFGEGTVRKLYYDHSKELGLSGDEETVGFGVHTYFGYGDGRTTRSYDEAPFKMPVEGNATAMVNMIWEVLDNDNLVAVAAKTIQPDGAVDIRFRNKY